MLSDPMLSYPMLSYPTARLSRYNSMRRRRHLGPYVRYGVVREEVRDAHSIPGVFL